MRQGEGGEEEKERKKEGKKERKKEGMEEREKQAWQFSKNSSLHSKED